MIEFVTENQNLLVAVLGFLGVMLTVVSNGRLNRAQHSRELEQERRSIKKALIKELQSLAEAYELRISQFSDTDGRKIIITEHKCNDVYLSLLPKVGFLNEVEIEKVLSAYQLNDELHIRLVLLSSDIEALENNRHVIITGDKADIAKNIHIEFLKIVRLAIKELEINK